MPDSSAKHSLAPLDACLPTVACLPVQVINIPQHDVSLLASQPASPPSRLPV